MNKWFFSFQPLDCGQKKKNPAIITAAVSGIKAGVRGADFCESHNSTIIMSIMSLETTSGTSSRIVDDQQSPVFTETECKSENLAIAVTQVHENLEFPIYFELSPVVEPHGINDLSTPVNCQSNGADLLRMRSGKLTIGEIPFSYPEPCISYVHAWQDQGLWHNLIFGRSWWVLSKEKKTKKRPEDPPNCSEIEGQGWTFTDVSYLCFSSTHLRPKQTFRRVIWSLWIDRSYSSLSLCTTQRPGLICVHTPFFSPPATILCSASCCF